MLLKSNEWKCHRVQAPSHAFQNLHFIYRMPQGNKLQRKLLWYKHWTMHIFILVCECILHSPASLPGFLVICMSTELSGHWLHTALGGLDDRMRSLTSHEHLSLGILLFSSFPLLIPVSHSSKSFIKINLVWRHSMSGFQRVFFFFFSIRFMKGMFCSKLQWVQ